MPFFCTQPGDCCFSRGVQQEDGFPFRSTSHWLLIHSHSFTCIGSFIHIHWYVRLPETLQLRGWRWSCLTLPCECCVIIIICAGQNMSPTNLNLGFVTQKDEPSSPYKTLYLTKEKKYLLFKPGIQDHLWLTSCSSKRVRTNERDEGALSRLFPPHHL